jgi:nitrogen fixation protein FixH
MGVILAATVMLNFYVMHLARSDASFAVEPDYYARAVHWDDELAQRSRNAALGWRLSPTLSRDGSDGVHVRVRLSDAGGRPVVGASLEVEAFAIARSAQVQRMTLASAGDPAEGAYDGRLALSHPGQWELRVSVTRGEERFTAVHRVEAPR